MEATRIQSAVKVRLGCVVALFSSQLASHIFKAESKLNSLEYCTLTRV